MRIYHACDRGGEKTCQHSLLYFEKKFTILKKNNKIIKLSAKKLKKKKEK